MEVSGYLCTLTNAGLAGIEPSRNIYVRTQSTRVGLITESTLGAIVAWSATYVSSSSSSPLSLSSSVSSPYSSLRSSSRPIAMAKLIVAETTALEGTHLYSRPSFLSLAHPLKT